MVTAFTLDHMQMEVIRLRTILLKSACCDTDKRWFTPLFRRESQDERDWPGKKWIKLHWNGSENAHFVLRCLSIFLFSRARPYCIPSGHLCTSVTWCNYPERSVYCTSLYIRMHQLWWAHYFPFIFPSLPELKCVSVIRYISWRGRCSHIYYMERSLWKGWHEIRGGRETYTCGVIMCVRACDRERVREREIKCPFVSPTCCTYGFV